MEKNSDPGTLKKSLKWPSEISVSSDFPKFEKMWFSFVVFGKSEEAEISDGHLSDFLRVPGSEIFFPSYTSLGVKKCKFL